MIHSLLIVRNHKLELEISKKQFREVFSNSYINRNTEYGKHFKGNIENDSFIIKPRSQLTNFSMDTSRTASGFYELAGHITQNQKKLIVDLTIRIKPILQYFWIFCAIIFLPVASFSSKYGLLVFIVIGLFIYGLLKMRIYMEDPFFIDTFKDVYRNYNNMITGANSKS